MSGPALSPRRRDPLECCPLFPEPPRVLHASGRCRSRGAMLRRITSLTNGCIRALRALAVGDLSSAGDGGDFGEQSTWDSCGATARRVSERVLEAHWEAQGAGLYEQLPESALVRLLSAPAGGYEFGGDTTTKEDDEEKGTIVPLASGIASLPPVGSQPAELTLVSAKARRNIAKFTSGMLVPADELDMNDVAHTRVYEDPSLKQKGMRVRFAADLYQAGLLGMTSRQVCSVSVFFVVKRREEQGLLLRPVWDCRLVNKYFQKPPRIRLGGPQGMTRLDLSPEVVDGKKLRSAWGDVPEFFYKCATPPCVWPYMTLALVTPKALQAELAKRGVVLKLGPRDLFVALRVAIMGWSWAPCLCHGALEDILVDRAFGYPAGGQLVDQLAAPSFLRSAFVFWLYMDDYCTTTLVAEGEDHQLDAAAKSARLCLETAGMSSHKEGSGEGVPVSLGVTISPGLVLHVVTAKMARVVQGTLMILERGRATAKEMQKLLGHWVWILMCARPAFSVLSAAYRFVEASLAQPGVRLPIWSSVRDELRTLCSLAPLLRTNLAASWSTTVFATDASEEGFGVVYCTATAAEAVAEADAAVGDDSSDDEACSPTPRPWHMTSGGRKMADIFCGSGGFGAAVARHTGADIAYVDLALDSTHDLLQPRFRRQWAQRIMGYEFFFVHFAPPCSTWSRARAPPLRAAGAKILGVPGLNPQQTHRLKEGTALARACVYLARCCLRSGVAFSIENPQSSLMWQWAPMRALMADPRVFVVDLVFCSFGAAWLKPTRLITTVQAMLALGGGCRGGHSHIALRGIAPCGTLWTKIVCPYPLGSPMHADGLSPSVCEKGSCKHRAATWARPTRSRRTTHSCSLPRG